MIHKQISKSALILFIAFIFYSCSYDGPVEIFQPDESGATKPEIVSISPSDLALAQYTEVKISGNNFATGLDSTSRNTVYFNNMKGTVISESPTEIVVIPPLISGDDINVKVIVPGAFEFAEMPGYRVERLSTKSAGFTELDKILSMAVDANENLYAALKVGKSITIYKVAPGENKVEFGTAIFPVVTEMRIGPNNELYMVPGTKDIYKISAAGEAASVSVTLPVKIKYFDFDQNQNMYTAGTKTAVYKVTSDGNFTEVGDFSEFDLKSLRVFDGHIYFSAIYKGSDDSVPSDGVWRSQISATDGILGAIELVYDWNESGDFSSSKIGTLTLAADGTMFIGCDNDDNPILIVNPDGSSEALYSGSLFTKTVQFVWGNSTTLYHNIVNNNEEIENGVYEVIVIDWESAPYFGRQ